MRFLLTYMREEREKNWRKIEEEAEKAGEGALIIGGDFNARVRREGGRLEEVTYERNSRDTIKNKTGEELLERIREKGLHIINGDTEGDREGDFTYVGGGGRSVIDYIITEEKEGTR